MVLTENNKRFLERTREKEEYAMLLAVTTT